MQQPVVIVPYDPEWQTHFAALRAILLSALGDLALAIEHVGSTSVPGLAAKPILDIDVIIESREDLPAVIAALGTIGYTHEGDKGVSGREAFQQADTGAPALMAHHLYVCDRQNRELHRHLTFRDYLRAHPDAAAAYGDLKYQLAERFGSDRDGYSEAKTDFVEAALRAASIKTGNQSTNFGEKS